jgi:hypothetical protein
VKGNTLKPAIAWPLFILSIALITPTTLAYIPASLYLFMAVPEAPALALFIPLAGYGIYSAWCLTLNMDEYTQYGTPPHTYAGIIAGIIALLIITKTFNLGIIEPIKKSPLSALIMGYGPLISSSASLLAAYFMRQKNHQEQV